MHQLIRTQPLIKYIGSKHKFAREIINYFPAKYNNYFEPFFGSGAVLAHLSPKTSVAGDINKSLIAMWQMVKDEPAELLASYREHLELSAQGEDKKNYFSKVKAAYNAAPNPKDFLFISRACYGGVIRYRKDGYLSTPVGVHTPISADAFAKRLVRWHSIVHNTMFRHADFAELVAQAGEGDLIYCDPPYVDTQSILYGSQAFSLNRLFKALSEAKKRGAYIVVSIDGTKQSGKRQIAVEPPEALFDTEVFIALGGSMLKRFSREGLHVEDEKVTDRLLLSYDPRDVQGL